MDTKWTAFIFASLFSGAAIAAGGSDFQSMDKNGDGYLSQDEAQGNSSLQEKWNDADLNDDGQLDRSEFSQFETMGGSGTSGSGTSGYGTGGSNTGGSSTGGSGTMSPGGTMDSPTGTGTTQ